MAVVGVGVVVVVVVVVVVGVAAVVVLLALAEKEERKVLRRCLVLILSIFNTALWHLIVSRVCE